MWERISKVLAIITSITTLVFGGGWYQEHAKAEREDRAARERIIREVLRPVEVLLQTNKDIYAELSSPQYAEPNWGVLESYLIKTEKEGKDSQPEMKQRIERLVKNNQVIVDHLLNYTGSAKTDVFKSQARAFINHAMLYGDRWASIPQVLRSHAKFSTGAPVFPIGFPDAMKQEIMALQNGT